LGGEAVGGSGPGVDQQLPVVAAGLDAGVVNVEQARIIAPRWVGVPGSVKAEAETSLVATRQRFRPGSWVGWRSGSWKHVDADLAAQQEVSQGEAATRRVCGAELNLVDVAGTSRVRVHAGWTGKAPRCCAPPWTRCPPPRRGPNEADLRSPGQRRADALVEVCQRVLAFGKLPDNRWGTTASGRDGGL